MADTAQELELITSMSTNTINSSPTKQELFLPEELFLEIFTKLPTKSVGKCRCVSKHWSILLSTTHFIKKHLTTRQKHSSKLKQESLVLVDERRSFLVITSPTVKHQESVKDLSRELASMDFFSGSCNGLVLVENEKDKLVLVNPITLKQVELPGLAKTGYDLLDKEWSRSLVVFGFGYDCVSDEYKVVAVCCFMNFLMPIRKIVVQVFSVKKSGCWRVLEDAGGYGDMFPARKRGVLVNGALHWSTGVGVTNYRSLIAAFDLASETFRVIEFPSMFDKRILFNEVMSLGGCLCMVDSTYGRFVDLWMMKEYGVVESWTKVRILGGGLWEDIKLLCFVGDEEVIGASNREKWFLCHVTRGTCKEVVVAGKIRAPYCDSGSFVDSLVDPEKLVEEVTP